MGYYRASAAIDVVDGEGKLLTYRDWFSDVWRVVEQRGAEVFNTVRMGALMSSHLYIYRDIKVQYHELGGGVYVGYKDYVVCLTDDETRVLPIKRWDEIGRNYYEAPIEWYREVYDLIGDVLGEVV